MARSAWTRKTYEMVAEAIKEAVECIDSADAEFALRHATANLAGQFRADNPQFDQHRFLSACGFGEK